MRQVPDVNAPKLVEHFPITDLDLRTKREWVRDDEVAVYIGGKYAGRLRHVPGAWVCDADLTARVPWPRGARTRFASRAAALRTISRRLRDAERWG